MMDEIWREITTLRAARAAMEDRYARMASTLARVVDKVFDPIITEDYGKRLDALERQMPAALGLTPVDRPATPVEQAINQINTDLDELRKRIDYHGIRLPAAKPTIKGGWVNVYRDFSAWHPTRQDADDAAWSQLGHRIACLRIPDFTEGEGL